MSLKAFHVAFVVIATLSMIFFGIWAVNAYRVEHQALHLAMAIFSVAAVGSLLFYGTWFLKKMKDVSYL